MSVKLKGYQGEGLSRSEVLTIAHYCIEYYDNAGLDDAFLLELLGVEINISVVERLADEVG